MPLARTYSTCDDSADSFKPVAPISFKFLLLSVLDQSNAKSAAGTSTGVSTVASTDLQRDCRNPWVPLGCPDGDTRADPRPRRPAVAGRAHHATADRAGRVDRSPGGGTPAAGRRRPRIRTAARRDQRVAEGRGVLAPGPVPRGLGVAQRRLPGRAGRSRPQPGSPPAVVRAALHAPLAGRAPLVPRPRVLVRGPARRCRVLAGLVPVQVQLTPD